jgi:hypothetical protein
MKTMAKASVLQNRQEEHIKQEKENFVLCANPYIVNVHATFQDPTMLYMVPTPLLAWPGHFAPRGVPSALTRVWHEGR